MIIGIGTDILETVRIVKAQQRWGRRFRNKILTPYEIEQMERNADPIRFLARRFCAKEAVSKALGTGMKSGVSFPQIEVRHDIRGAPLVVLGDRALEIYEEKAAKGLQLSISDEKTFTLAFAVLY